MKFYLFGKNHLKKKTFKNSNSNVSQPWIRWTIIAFQNIDMYVFQKRSNKKRDNDVQLVGPVWRKLTPLKFLVFRSCTKTFGRLYTMQLKRLYFTLAFARGTTHQHKSQSYHIRHEHMLQKLLYRIVLHK